jgi:hypothetical protein
MSDQRFDPLANYKKARDKQSKELEKTIGVRLFGDKKKDDQTGTPENAR